MSGESELTRLIPDGSRMLKKPDEEHGGTNGSSNGGSSGVTTQCCSSFWKPFVFGGFDGTILAMTITSAAAGANLSWRIIVVVGFAGAIASAVVTGVNDFLSSKAHREFILAEKRRELWEYKHFREAQIFEMVNRFEARGMLRRDAEAVVSKISQYDSFFVSLMVAEDLGLQLADDNDGTLLTDALVMLLSYLLFSCAPILIYGLGAWDVMDSASLYLTSVGISLVVLVVLGVVKGSVSSSSWVSAGLEALLMGALCSGLAFGLGRQLMVLMMS